MSRRSGPTIVMTSDRFCTSARNRSSLRRSASSASTRSVTSRPATTTPRTAGLSSRLLPIASRYRHEPSACWTRTMIGPWTPGSVNARPMMSVTIGLVVGVHELQRVEPERRSRFG